MIVNNIVDVIFCSPLMHFNSIYRYFRCDGNSVLAWGHTDI